MITTKTKLRFNSNNRKEILQTVYRLSELDLKSKGCLKIEVWKDVSDKNILYLVEDWSSAKDMEKHNLSKSMAVLCGLQFLLVEDLQTIHTVQMGLAYEW
jgi:quinol monooxygenase YgiN